MYSYQGFSMMAQGVHFGHWGTSCDWQSQVPILLTKPHQLLPAWKHTNIKFVTWRKTKQWAIPWTSLRLCPGKLHPEWLLSEDPKHSCIAAESVAGSSVWSLWLKHLIPQSVLGIFSGLTKEETANVVRKFVLCRERRQGWTLVRRGRWQVCFGMEGRRELCRWLRGPGRVVPQGSWQLRRILCLCRLALSSCKKKYMKCNIFLDSRLSSSTARVWQCSSLQIHGLCYLQALYNSTAVCKELLFAHLSSILDVRNFRMLGELWTICRCPPDS